MAPAPSPEQPDKLYEMIMAYWTIIAGGVFAFWSLLKLAWNFGGYNQGINDRFDKLEREISELKDIMIKCDVRSSCQNYQPRMSERQIDSY